jgi:hypothetical protein
MSRHLITVVFWVGIATSALLVGVTTWASSPPHRVLNLVGFWDGFFFGSDGQPGRVQSAITQQDFRRLAGDGALLPLGDGDPINTYAFRATMPRDDFLAGTGVTPTGRLVFQAYLETYGPKPRFNFETIPNPGAGDAEDAGLMYPEFHFVPSRGSVGQFGAILLHPFPGGHTPDVSGQGAGSFLSLTDSTFFGALQVTTLPRERGSFYGHVDFSFPESPQHSPFSWPFFATTSSEGRILMIAQGKTGRLLYDGIAIPGGVDQTPTFVGGFYRISFLDGGFNYGAYNFNLAP